MYGSVEQAFVGRNEPKNGCEGGYPYENSGRDAGEIRAIKSLADERYRA